MACIPISLIFTFALLIYSLYHARKRHYLPRLLRNVAGCLYRCSVTFPGYASRLYSAVATRRSKNAMIERSQLYVNLFVYCHKILIPILFILILIGFGIVYISLKGKRQITTCLPSFAVALLEFFLLLFAIGSLCA